MSEEEPRRSGTVLEQISRTSTAMTFFAIVAALVVSSILIVAADPAVRDTVGYFFARPTDTLSAAWDAISGAYTSLFRGSIVDYQASSAARFFRPITETMVSATPLIFAALGIGIGFRAGLFNIGAQGQLLMGAALATWIGFALDLPIVLHVLVALLGAAVMGGAWGAIAGVLKARTGANEVIVTIMLNWVAVWLITWLLTTPILALSPTRPISPKVDASAQLPLMLGGQFRLHWGFVLALLAAVGVWWLMERSTIGFKFRAVGANMNASRTAGINVNVMYMMVMLVAGLLAGLGGASRILGVDHVLRASSAGSLGFDAITVALLGRNRPGGIVAASLLFGALRAGAPLMQTVSHTPIDIVLVIQAVIVLFIAAPPLVRTIFHLPGRPARRQKEATA